MGARTFAQINISLLRSKKIERVSHAARWAYVCTHLSKLATFTGVFNYPAILWARDAGLDDADLCEMRDSLVDVGLIEWCDEEELVRIVGFHRQRPPHNASWCINLVNDFEGMLSTYDDPAIILGAAAEFAVAAVSKSTNWKPEQTQIVRDCIGRFLRATCQEFEDEFLCVLLEETESASKSVMSEFDSLIPELSYHRANTLRTPCQDRADIQRQDLDKDQNKEKEENKDAREVSKLAIPASSQTEPLDLQRTGEIRNRGSQILPMESTKRSALVAAARG